MISAIKKIASSLPGRGAEALLSIPILADWLFWLFHPSYWFNSDPAAWYFLDSLAVFAGKPYAYVDHPGTPVHIIGSVLLGLSYPFFGNSQKLIQYFIAKPEAFFFGAHLFLLGMSLLTVWGLYRSAIKSLQTDKTLSGLALSLMYFAIHPQAFSSLTYWSHNSFNFIFGTLWLLWLYTEIQKGRLTRPKDFLLGLTAGALVTTQLYLLPWLAGGAATVFCLTLLRDRALRAALADGLIFAAGSLFGLLLLLLPAYQALPQMFGWMKRLIGSQGLYGTGQAGVYTLQLIPLSLEFWSQHAPILIGTLGLTLALSGLSLWKARRAQLKIAPADLALTLGLTLQTLLLLLVLGKFFYRLRYTLSLAALLPILALLALRLSEAAKLNLCGIKRLVLAGLTVSLLVYMGQEMKSQHKKALDEHEASISRSQVVRILAKQKEKAVSDLVVVYASGTPLKCAGLLMANNWIRAFDAEVAALCPNQYAIYDFKYEVNLNILHPIPQIEHIDWDVVLWPGNGSDLPIYLEAAGAREIPSSWGLSRARWFFIRP